MQVSLANLNKSYNGINILDINSLVFKRGVISALLGPNGTGKTTLLNIIAGLDKNFTGKVKYNDMNYSEAIGRKITMLFQNVQLFRRSVYENIEYPLRLRGFSRENRKNKVRRVMDLLGITHLMSKRGHFLSGGEIQKVALARSIVFEPELLLLDEPTSNLDPESLEAFENHILKYNKDTNNTIIYVTHNLEHAKRVCREAYFLRNGEVIKEDGIF